MGVDLKYFFQNKNCIEGQVAKSFKSEFVTWFLLLIFFAAYIAWLRKTPATAKFFWWFLAAWLLKMTVSRAGWKIKVPDAVFSLHSAVLISLAVFLYSYFTHHFLPEKVFEKGWFGWWDQSRYLLMAQDLAGLELVTEHYLYGIGYPALGALFYKLYPTNPFFPSNVILYVLVAALTYKTARVWLDEKLSLLVIILLVLGTQFTEFFVVPWNNAVSAVGLAFLLYLAFAKQEIGIAHSVIVGIVLGWVFSARYVDVLFLLPISAYILLRGGVRRNAVMILVSAVVALIILVAVLYTHSYAFGSVFKTPYTLHVQAGGHDDQSLAAYRLTRVPDHLYSIFINPYQFHGLRFGRLNTPLLGYSFFFLFSFSGLLHSLSGRLRTPVLIVFGSMFASAVFYGSFTGTRASDLKYNCLRYFLMWYPVMATMSVLAISKFTAFTTISTEEKRRLVSGTGFIMLLIAASFLVLSLSYRQSERYRIPSSRIKVRSNYNNAMAGNATDGDIATRWDSAEPQKPGMFLHVELDSIERLDRIKLLLRENTDDYPRGLKVEGSKDGKEWRDLAEIRVEGIPLLTDDAVELELKSAEARYLRLTQTGKSESRPWSVHELLVYAR